MSHSKTQRIKIPKRFTVGLFIAIVIYVPAYVLVTQLYGIPLWWAFPFFSLSTLQQNGKFVITFNPDQPMAFGQIVVVSVTNTTQQAVWNATVNVIYNGNTVY